MNEVEPIDPQRFDQPCGNYPERNHVEVYYSNGYLHGDLLGHLDITAASRVMTPGQLVVVAYNRDTQQSVFDYPYSSTSLVSSSVRYIEFRVERMVRDNGWTMYFCLTTSAPIEHLLDVSKFIPYGTPTPVSPILERKQRVWDAARIADKEFDGPHPDSQGVTRSEYVGRAVIKELYK